MSGIKLNSQQVGILVDLRADGPDYYVMPTWWIENDIFTVHHDYLDKNDGHRVKNDASTHHSIPLSRVKKRKDRWDVLGILPAQ